MCEARGVITLTVPSIAAAGVILHRSVHACVNKEHRSSQGRDETEAGRERRGEESDRTAPGETAEESPGRRAERSRPGVSLRCVRRRRALPRPRDAFSAAPIKHLSSAQSPLYSAGERHSGKKRGVTFPQSCRGFNPAERGGGPRRLRGRRPVREDETGVRVSAHSQVWRNCTPGQGARQGWIGCGGNRRQTEYKRTGDSVRCMKRD